MSSFYEDASLVMIPSGYKTSKVYSAKPTDGAGDLSFTRSNDTATRVNSAGLIEKVRTNLITYSQAFDNAAWTKGGVGTYTSAITTGFTDPNGGTNAQRWLATIASVSDRAFVRQLATLTNGIPYTISFWVKSNTASSQDIYFMFQGGAVQATTVTTSWQRISYSATTSTTSVLVGIEAKSLAIDVLVYGFQLESGDIMTDYIATTSAAVSVGPVANVPRLDYLNSSCPRLLLEPQRQNVITFSEQMDNAAWGKANCSISANALISPDGTQDADYIIEDSSASTQHRASISVSGTTNTVHTLSVFIKQGSGTRNAYIDFGPTYCYYNFSTGAISAVGGTASVQNYGNGWFRLIITQTSASTPATVYIGLANGNNETYTGNGTSSIAFWGAQLEAGAYATSYIPTLGAAVTRGADECSKTGISSLIGQTEGVLFVDFVPNNTPAAGVAQWLMFLGAGTNFISIYIVNQKLLGSIAATTDQCSIFTSYNLQAGTRYKAALAYKANDFAFYVNGVQIGVDTSGTVPAVSTLQNNYNTTAANSVNAGLNQALLFKTRLPNSELASLTAL